MREMRLRRKKTGPVTTISEGPENKDTEVLENVEDAHLEEQTLMMDPGDTPIMGEYDDQGNDFSEPEVKTSMGTSNDMPTENRSATPSHGTETCGVDEVRTLIDSLRGDLEHIRVEFHRMKTKLVAMERAAEISNRVLSRKMAEGEQLKKDLENLSNTVKGLSMSQQTGVPCAPITRRVIQVPTEPTVSTGCVSTPDVDMVDSSPSQTRETQAEIPSSSVPHTSDIADHAALASEDSRGRDCAGKRTCRGSRHETGTECGASDDNNRRRRR
ncbi:hypothetical protein M758_UG324200 [Ceratodon purpureus]|nr:hypothetical protein M758_UG324200 [Ceratodon purpureus]